MAKKSEDKIRGRVRLPEKEDTQHHPLLPVACPCLPTSLPLAPPSPSFSQMLQKSGTVIKAISDIYSGDVQYKA